MTATRRALRPALSEAQIVVVEDSFAHRHRVRITFELKGSSVHDAARVADALRVFDHVKPDLVVLDMQLPDGNGFDVLEHIRSRGDVPTLFVTAATGVEDRVAALDRGAHDYLLKPFSPEELVAPADAALRRHVTAAAHRAGHGWRSDPPAAP